MKNHADYYIYALFRDDGSPFYIGRGRGRRIVAHNHEARKGGSLHHHRIIRDMLSRDAEIPRIKLHENLTFDVANAYEKALIAAIGKHPHGPLTNITDGGGGTEGRTMSAAHLAALRASNLGTKRTDEARARIKAGILASSDKIRAAKLGKKRSPETVEKIRANKSLPENVAIVGARYRGKKLLPEHVAKMAAAKLGTKRSPETVEKIRVASTGRRHSPEACAKVSAARLAFEARKRAAAAEITHV